MDDILDDIVTPGFSLNDFSVSNIDNINETVTNSINDINDSIVENSDYTIFIYIGIIFCVVIVIIIVYNYYKYNKKCVTFCEDNNEHYNYS